jgi:ABC-type Fe3+ transport system permease subunit
VLVFLLERLALPGRRGLRLLLLVPLIVPPQILAIAWLGWAGPAGILTRGCAIGPSTSPHRRGRSTARAASSCC